MKLNKSLKLYKENNLKKYLQILTSADFISSMFNLSFIRILIKFKLLQKTYYEYRKIRFMFTKKVSIPWLTTVLTTYCTLNCKNCCHYMPDYNKDTHYPVIKLDDFKSDIDSLLKNIDEISCFQISGGEPLLCKDLPAMIHFLAKKRQIKNIFITTNCTIIPSNELLKALNKHNIVVQISDYRKVAPQKCHYNEIKNLLIKNKIKICAWEEDMGTSFRSMPEIFFDNSRSEDILKKQFKKCTDSQYIILCDGKLFNCPTALHVYSNKNKINGFVNVRDSQVTNQNYIDFYNIAYTEYCNYCHRENIKYGFEVGEQVPPPRKRV